MNTVTRKKKPRVLMIGPGRNVKGGITTVVNSYYELGLDKDVDLKYITTMVDGSKIVKLFVAIFSYLHFCMVLKNYDIVHIHMAAQASFYRKAYFVKKAKKAHKKIIIHQHAGNFDSFFLNECSEKKKVFINHIFSLADKIIVLSKEWASFFEKNVCDRTKIKIINNGVIFPNYQKMDYQNHNILFLGRITKTKGIYELLESISVVSEKYKDVKLYVAGDGEELEKCQALTKNLGIEQNVVFLGWINNIDVYMKKCSVFVLPSYFECMPVSVLEAMSYGLATISTNVGSVPQIIDNNINGLLIEKENVTDIINSILLLLDNSEKKQRLGEEACKKIDMKYSASFSLSLLVQLYSKLN